MNIREVIGEFLKEQGYLNDANIEGVIFYGSYQTNTNTNSSDVDLMIVYNDESNKESIKGYKSYNGYNFEYFERTLSSLYKRADFDYLHFPHLMILLLVVILHLDLIVLFSFRINIYIYLILILLLSDIEFLILISLYMLFLT